MKRSILLAALAVVCLTGVGVRSVLPGAGPRVVRAPALALPAAPAPAPAALRHRQGQPTHWHDALLTR